jgi:hypothetical protein
VRIGTSDLRFVRRGLQPIELPFETTHFYYYIILIVRESYYNLLNIIIFIKYERTTNPRGCKQSLNILGQGLQATFHLSSIIKVGFEIQFIVFVRFF